MEEEGEETIRVLTVRGKQYRLPADDATTLAQLKQRLATLAGIPQEQQEIIINGALCRDPTTPLTLFGNNPVCILARKLTDQNKLITSDYKIIKGESKASQRQACEQCLHKQRPIERFLNREEEAAYRKELEGSYSRDLVRQLRNVIQVDEDTAIRAVRASCNNLPEAFEFVQLEQRGQNYQDYQLDQQPPRDARYQQSYLQNYVIQQNLFRRLTRSKHQYTLFVASMKEKSPIIYDMFVRNRIFMEKLLFEEHEHNHMSGVPLINVPQPYGIGSKTSMPSLRVRVFEQEKMEMIARLQQMTGVARYQAQSRLKMAGNNWTLALEMLLEDNNDEYSVELYQIPQANRESLLQIFLQSPAWAPLKNRLRMMAPRAAFDLVQRKIIKYFPAVLSLSNNLWPIYPLLIRVPYSAIEFVNLTGIRQALRLRQRSKQQIEQCDKFYQGLVDRQLVETLTVLGVERSLAERATRAGVNMSYSACRWVRLGSIPIVVQAWAANEDKDYKEIDYYMCYYFKPILHDFNEFNLAIAAMREKNPLFYNIFLKYAGIYEAYGGSASHFPQSISATQRDRRNMKKMLQQLGDIDALIAYGVKMTMMSEYQ